MKTLIAFVMVLNLLLMVSTAGAVVIMDATHHNGGFYADTYGFWYNTPTAIPAGWVEAVPSLYSTAAKWVTGSANAIAVNNTGEIVAAGQAFTVSADLGGPGWHPWVRVFATTNADGSGAKTLLASVDRFFPADTANYTFFNTVGAAGSPVPSGLAGQYIQVEIGGSYTDFGYDIRGYYDNIVVTATPEPATIGILALGGIFLRKIKNQK